jgi:hypothetical protein
MISSKLAAVEVADPGASYNPSYEHHQDLLGIALAREIEKIEKEDFIEQKVKSLIRKRKHVLLDLLVLLCSPFRMRLILNLKMMDFKRAKRRKKKPKILHFWIERQKLISISKKERRNMESYFEMIEQRKR